MIIYPFYSDEADLEGVLPREPLDDLINLPWEDIAHTEGMMFNDIGSGCREDMLEDTVDTNLVVGLC